MKVTVFVIRFKFPSGSTMYFYESLKREFCITPDPDHATHFETRLKAEEYLLNLKFDNPGNAVIEKFDVIEHSFQITNKVKGD